MILAELLAFFKELGTLPKRALSQNFLIDPNTARKIVRSADVQPKDVVLEIGSGAGALTAPLLDAGATVQAIEKDPLLAGILSRLQTSDHRLSVCCADALTFPFASGKATKVVANLPYHITTPLLERLFVHDFSSLTLMVQKEFGERLLAKPGSKDFSSLTLFCQFYTSIEEAFSVSSHCFYPRPKVDSAVIRFKCQKPPLDEPAPFFALVRRAFQQRRKMLSTSLKEIHPAVQEILGSLSLRKDARPEMLGLAEWLRLFKALRDSLSIPMKPVTEHFF